MAVSPMMQQYLQIKEQYKDAILFFRLGDFYEMFFDDAILVSRELELTLKRKDCGLYERAHKRGEPFHSAETYLARLVKKGALTTQRQGKGYLYYPALSQSQCQLEESKSFLHRVYGGSLSKMVLGFVESGTLSPQELEELKALVNQQEQRHDSH